MPEYHLVGDPFDANDPPTVFELRLRDHVICIDPIEFKITQPIIQINPSSYFITSGDALDKSIRLEKDLWTLAGKLRAEKGSRPTKKYVDYTSAVWKCAGKGRALVHKLREVKGSNSFLETEWDNNGCLLCITKNPRAKTKI